MGWCSGTYIFDAIMEGIVDKKIRTDEEKIEFIKEIISELENMDWDCQEDSWYYWNNELVETAFKELHPSWFKEKE